MEISDLAERVKNECAGVYYGGSQAGVPTVDLFGIPSDFPLYGCIPRENISVVSPSYWRISPHLRTRIFSGEGESCYKSIERGIYFIHYPLNKKRFTKRLERQNFDITGDLPSFISPESVTSCIYSNFIGEVIYVGQRSLLQQVIDIMKDGERETKSLLTALTGRNQERFDKYNLLFINDTLSKPSLVCHRS